MMFAWFEIPVDWGNAESPSVSASNAWSEMDDGKLFGFTANKATLIQLRQAIDMAIQIIPDPKGSG